MRLKELHITNIRNHADTKLELSPTLNIFTGKNGSGKTSALEAIVVCSFSKTFLPTSDAELMRTGEEYYQTSAVGANDLDVNYKVNIRYDIGKRKNISSSFGDNLLPKDIIGEIPLSILSPDFKAITFGAPQDRRDFVDRLLSQTSKMYFEALLNLKKCLKQRNTVLHSFKLNPRQDRTFLDLWSEELAKIGAEVFHRRALFIEKFKPFLIQSYSNISQNIENIEFVYAPSIDFALSNSKDEIREIFLKELLKNKEREIGRGSTLYGPQKDEFIFKLNGRTAKETASQGQHKSLLISLKFAEFEFLKLEKVETPIILLDDIFSELDADRSRQTLESILELKAQTFITMVDDTIIQGAIKGFSDISRFEISNGKAV